MVLKLNPQNGVLDNYQIDHYNNFHNYEIINKMRKDMRIESPLISDLALVNSILSIPSQEFL